MNRATAVFLTCAGAMIFAAGCESTRNHRGSDTLAYIDHMMVEDGGVASDPVYDPVVDPLTRFPSNVPGAQNQQPSPALPDTAAGARRSPRVFIIESPERDRRAPVVGAADIELETTAVSYSRQVMRRLAVLERHVARIQAQAEQKGAVALAELDPELRDYRAAVKKIEEQMESPDLTDRGWPDPEDPRIADVDAYLEQAEQAVQRADEKVTAARYMDEQG